MKKLSIYIMIICMLVNCNTYYADEPEYNELYSLGACIIDGESGRVLYEKNGYEVMSMASTTKIMTCIIALEYGDLNDIVKISKYAASMPDVQLNAVKDDEFYLKDLLFALMLESHNDVAVAIAEHIGGSVSGFAKLMNDKAKDLGCFDTYFITPNGLDATDDNGKKHATTATDLAKIMAYCIKNQEFVDITTTRNYSFNNVSGSRSYNVNNKNSFLDMMDGVISGKTGFTNDAGYCYVCALERDGKVYVISLLGCGWPYNKNYKWSDSKTLFNYGINEYDKKTYDNNIALPKILVKNGYYYNENGINAGKDVFLEGYINTEEFELLIGKEESLEYEIVIKNIMDAPIDKGDVIGYVKYFVDEQVVKKYNIYAKESIGCIDFKWILKGVVDMFFMK